MRGRNPSEKSTIADMLSSGYLGWARVAGMDIEEASVDLERSRKRPRSYKCSVVTILDDVPGRSLSTVYVFCVMKMVNQRTCRVGCVSGRPVTREGTLGREGRRVPGSDLVESSWIDSLAVLLLQRRDAIPNLRVQRPEFGLQSRLAFCRVLEFLACELVQQIAQPALDDSISKL